MVNYNPKYGFKDFISPSFWGKASESRVARIVAIDKLDGMYQKPGSRLGYWKE